jgi:hypothetical protein
MIRGRPSKPLLPFEEYPSSRKDAVGTESKYYFTGISCKWGHISIRFTCNGGCRECFFEKAHTQYQKDRDRKRRNKIEYREYHSKYARTEKCIIKAKEYSLSSNGKISRSNAVKRYLKTDKGKVTNKKACKKYNVSILGKESSKRRSKRSLENADVSTKLAANLRKRQNKLFKNKHRVGSFVRDLGCTVEEAILYWQSLLTWNPEWTWADHGKLFEMDHVLALCFFDLEDREEFLQAAHYTNLQPLSIEAHRGKSIADNRFIRFV